MNKQEKLIWNKLKNEYADNTEVLDVLCGGENAREKQIPKKPIENFYDEQNGDDWYDEGYTYQCPLCEESEVGRYSKEMCEWVYQMAHCEKCGQAIDWRNDGE